MPTGEAGAVSPASFCSFGNDQRHDKCRGRTPPASVSQNLHPPLRECQVRPTRWAGTWVGPRAPEKRNIPYLKITLNKSKVIQTFYLTLKF